MIEDFRAAGLDALPGADIVERGIEDLKAGRTTVDACLVSIGAPRLASAGIAVGTPLPAPEDLLYSLLQREFGDGAHAKYNALVRRLVSFERSLPFGRP